MKKGKFENRFDVKLTESRGTARENYLDSLRENVRSYMRECGYTAEDLAEIADTPVSTFRDFLYGNTATVKLTPVIRLAKEFGVSIDELVGADTLAPETKESLQILRRLPEHFRYFCRWNIRETEKQRNLLGVKYKAVNMIRPKCTNSGGLKPTETYEVLDISHFGLDVRPKVFMAVKIPCAHYMPHYSPYHVLLIANDRLPKKNEHCLVFSSGMFWILTRSEEIEDGNKVVKYYSIRDGKFRCYEEEVDELVGYVASTHIMESR